MPQQEHRFLAHIALEVFNKPLMILPSKLDIIMRVLGSRIGLDNAEPVQPHEMAVARQPINPHATIGIGVVPIIGSFVHRNVTAPSGASTYENVGKRFDAALDDPKVDAILLDVDSPGGTVDGAFGLADRIYDARGKKPIYAHINESGYSAGYLLASAANKVLITKTGGAGSIGVRMVHVDQSEFDKKEGVKYTPLYVGERKMDFDPHSPLTEAARAVAMKDLEAVYNMFVETVTRNRGLDVSKVRSSEAGLFMGQDAVDFGLVDQVMSVEEAMSFIVDDVSQNKNKRLARKRAGNKEVKNHMPSLAELKAESPDIYNELMDQAKAEAEGALQAKLAAQKEGFQEQIKSLSGQVEKQNEEILKLQKDNFIRAESDRKARNDSVAETIWVKALSVCDIPEHMHGKVRNMVKTSDHLVDGVLNKEAFEVAVEAEIADWEGRGMKTSIIGSGFTGSTKTGDLTDPAVIAAQKQEQDDDALVEEYLALANGKKGGEK